MGFSKFFAQQARKPTGLFGRLVMSLIFDKGNADLNNFVKELLALEVNDHILEIGFGPGCLMSDMARQLNDGVVEGIEFSDEMITLAQKRNKIFINEGKVKLHKGNFDDFEFEKNIFTKICTVNTIYFWQEPEKTVKKMLEILKPGGKCYVAFGDKQNMQKRKLDTEVFTLYSGEEAQELFLNAVFASIKIETRKKGNVVYNCVVATK